MLLFLDTMKQTQEYKACWANFFYLVICFICILSSVIYFLRSIAQFQYRAAFHLHRYIIVYLFIHLSKDVKFQKLGIKQLYNCQCVGFYVDIGAQLMWVNNQKLGFWMLLAQAQLAAYCLPVFQNICQICTLIHMNHYSFCSYPWVLFSHFLHDFFKKHINNILDIMISLKLCFLISMG